MCIVCVLQVAKTEFDDWDELFTFLEITVHDELAHVLTFLSRQCRVTFEEVQSAAAMGAEFDSGYAHMQKQSAPFDWPTVAALRLAILNASKLETEDLTWAGISLSTGLTKCALQAIVANIRRDCVHDPLLPLQRLRILGPGCMALFSKADKGRTLRIQRGDAVVNGARRIVEWITAKHRGGSAKIVDVEPWPQGIVTLDDQTKFENPRVEAATDHSSRPCGVSSEYASVAVMMPAEAAHFDSEQGDIQDQEMYEEEGEGEVVKDTQSCNGPLLPRWQPPDIVDADRFAQQRKLALYMAKERTAVRQRLGAVGWLPRAQAAFLRGWVLDNRKTRPTHQELKKLMDSPALKHAETFLVCSWFAQQTDPDSTEQRLNLTRTDHLMAEEKAMQQRLSEAGGLQPAQAAQLRGWHITHADPPNEPA